MILGGVTIMVAVFVAGSMIGGHAVLKEMGSRERRRFENSPKKV